MKTHYSEDHLAKAKAVHLSLIEEHQLKDVFLTRQLYEYSFKHDGFRLTSEYYVEQLGNVIISSLTNVTGDDSAPLAEWVSVKRPEDSKYATIHRKNYDPDNTRHTPLTDKGRLRACRIINTYRKAVEERKKANQQVSVERVIQD